MTNSIAHNIGESMHIDISVFDMQIDTYSDAAIQGVLVHSLKQDYAKANDLRATQPLIQITVRREYPVGSVTPVYRKIVACIFPLNCNVDTGSLQLYLLDIYPDLQYISNVELLALEHPSRYIQGLSATTVKSVRELTNGTIDIEQSMRFAQSYKLYFNELILHPIKVTLMLQHTQCPKRESDAKVLTNVFHIIDMVGSLVEVNDLLVKIPAFQLSNSMQTLESVVIAYATQVQHEVQNNLVGIAGTYFGGLDILGKLSCFEIIHNFIVLM